jgi:GNAT superfamily N-acetyltransferase
MNTETLTQRSKADYGQIAAKLSAFGIAGDFPRALLHCGADSSCQCWTSTSGNALAVRVGWTILPLFEMSDVEATVALLASQEGLRQIIVPESIAQPVTECAKTLGAREPVIEILAEMPALRASENSAERVVRATPADRKRLAPLYPPARFNVTEFLTFEQRFEWAISTGRFYYIERNGQPVAACHTIAEGCGLAMIMGVVTDPAWRKNGFARTAVAKLCRDVLSDGLRPRLMFESDNAITRSLYESLGFQERMRFATIDLIPHGVPA